MLKGKLANGFSFSVDEDILDYWEFVEALNAADENPLKIVNVLNMLLGKDQKAKLIEHLGGRPKTSEMKEVITEIFAIIKDSKAKNL